MSEKCGGIEAQVPEYLFEPDKCALYTAMIYDPSPEVLEELEAAMQTAGAVASTVVQEIIAAGNLGIIPSLNEDGVWQAQPDFDQRLEHVAAERMGYGEANRQTVDLTAFNQWVHRLSLRDILAWVKQESKLMQQQLPPMVNSVRGEDPSYDINALDVSLRDIGLDITLRDRIREYLAFAGASIRLPDGGEETLDLMYWLLHTSECPSQPPHVQQSALRLRGTFDELYGSLFQPLLVREK
jgi:hypothetical protein